MDRSDPRLAQRIAGKCLLLGVVCYVLPTLLHGNPPIDDAAATLRYVAERPLWTIAHLANIAAVMLWAHGAAVLTSTLAAPVALVASVRTGWAIAAGVFAVYFSLHALGLRTAADQFGQADDPAAVIERTEALLLVLGSTAFVAQGLVGIAIALLALALFGSSVAQRSYAIVGMITGAGWAVGAVLINFMIIVPFTVLAWLWISVGAIILLLRGLPRG